MILIPSNIEQGFFKNSSGRVGIYRKEPYYTDVEK
jgi:hypothetical protein